MSGVLGGLLGSLKSGVSTSYESIASFYSLGTVTSYTFSSIPGTFKHLQLRMYLPGGTSVSATNLDIQVNGDTGTNYVNHWFNGTGTTVSASSQTSNPRIEEMVLFRSANTYPAGVILDILDYADTNKYKTFRTLSGKEDGNSGDVRITSHMWMSTSAITSIKVYPDNNNNFPPGVRLSLYGIKGA
jgi:hypothetical protein